MASRSVGQSIPRKLRFLTSADLYCCGAGDLALLLLLELEFVGPELVPEAAMVM